MIRKALLPVLAASAVMVSTPALAQNFSISFGVGSPGYSQGYGYGQARGYAPRDLNYRARVLSQRIDQLAWSRDVHPREARALARQMNQYQRLEYRYARNGLSRAEYRDLDRRLDRIQYQLQRTAYRTRW
ncbi:MAG: hypothetical protein QME55_13535 [Brevundimonas sp.]|uniref:hypothetical protein n=1 Tax=Brevundimonas sp. TaxID=1871086 RepID=UPI002636AF98|nr:hypothetical protein [Brevundimonas sp.]MDI6625748.1 hypothetical protein [Brevundimonas sp.]MDQ7814027.1 hypothetical protein [Brevundimonas sp.]